MKDIRTLHRNAMDKADLAILSKRKGDKEASIKYLHEAFLLEKEAALMLSNNIEQEPNRSILLKSAASLALESGEALEAEKLVCLALTGVPPENVAEDLRDLLEQIHFQRHLNLRGINLHENEVQMSLAGKGVGYGMAPTEIFTDRVIKTETLLFRTAERKQNKPYRDRGRRDKSIQDSVELYLSVPRAASFAVTFRVGQGGQLNLFDSSFEEQIIDELIDCLQLYVAGNNEDLKKRIPEESYYNNFIGLAGSIAPDGDEVNLVGFTSQRKGKTREVAIPVLKEKSRKVRAPVSVPHKEQENPIETIEIVGILKYADSRTEKDKIQIIDAGMKQHTLTVPTGMMSDIVKPLWDSKVEAVATKKGRMLILQDIREHK